MDVPELSRGSTIVPAAKLYSVEDASCHRSPMILTRDFNGFPFSLVGLTDEEREDNRFRNCLKFQVPDEYAAYIPLQFQDYIKPQHIYKEKESPIMKEVRKSFWGKTSDLEKARYRQTYPEEYRKLDKLWEKLNFKYIQDHESSYARLGGGALVNRFRRIEAKQTVGFCALATKNTVLAGLLLSIFLFTFASFWKVKKRIAFIKRLFSQDVINFNWFPAFKMKKLSTKL